MSKHAEPIDYTQGVEEVALPEIVKSNFLHYAIAVISDRALPSVADGLKPVQRRILWTMHLGKFSPSTPFVKSARIVGDALGKFHPHADGSVYGAMVNMTKEYSMMPLVDGQGNYGTRGEDKAAAMRYTEARLHKNAVDMYLSDLEENCVDFCPNYDQSLEEPTVLPTKAPTLLINGSLGIAVGIATKIPSHNLNEVLDMTLHLLDGNEELAFQAFRGPDFKSGGKMFVTAEALRSIFYTGKGSVRLYGRVEKEISKGKSSPGKLKILEIPWTTTKQSVIEKLIDLKSEIPDMQIMQSSKVGEPRITVTTREDLDRVEKLLFKKCELSESYSYNLLYLDGKIPQQKGVLDLILQWLEFRRQTLRRKFASEETHVLADIVFYSARKALASGLLDEFIAVLRNGTADDGKAFLIDRCGADPASADRILSMRLSSLSKDSELEASKTLDDLQSRATELQLLLTDRTVLDDFIRQELVRLKKYSPSRYVEILEDDLQTSETTTVLTSRKLAVVGPDKVLLGSGERLPMSASLGVIAENAVFRVRVKDFRKFRDGATVDLKTFGVSSSPILETVLQARTSLLCYSDGRAVLVDFDKVRESGAVRQIGIKAKLVKTFHFDELPDDFLVVVTTRGQLVVNRLHELGAAESRTLAKLRVSGGDGIRDALVVKPGQTIRATFKKGFAEIFKPEDLYRGKFSTQGAKLTHSKDLQSLEVVASADESLVEEDTNQAA